MHELALAQSLVDLVEREAEKQGFHRALEIRLRLGEYSGVIPGYILDLFPHVAENTAAEGAALAPAVSDAGTADTRARSTAGGPAVPTAAALPSD